MSAYTKDDKKRLVEGTPYEGWPEDKLNGPFYPDHVIHQVVQMLLVVVVLVTLATLLPAPMEPKADPFTTPEHIKPEWYFLGSYQFLKLAEKLEFLGAWAPKAVGIMGQGIVVLLLLALPFIDRGKERNPLRRPRAILLGALIILSFIALTVWGRLS